MKRPRLKEKLLHIGRKNCKHKWELFERPDHSYINNLRFCRKCGRREVWNMEGWQEILFDPKRGRWLYWEGNELMWLYKMKGSPMI